MTLEEKQRHRLYPGLIPNFGAFPLPDTVLSAVAEGDEKAELLLSMVPVV